jgi:aminoglycoside phosphotransferase (APT) family kinase protein
VEIRPEQLERIGGGREAEIYDLGGGRVLRLARDASRGASVDREVAALAAAGEAGAPVPAVHGRVDVDDRPGSIVDRLDGGDMLSRLQRRPWSVRSIGIALGRTHAALHAVAAPNTLPTVADELRARLGSPLVPAEMRATALEELERLPGGRQLCHGDFHPGNLLRSHDDFAVIDWTLGAGGPPVADVARTRLLITGGGLPPDAGRVLTGLESVGRTLLLRAYLAGYRSSAPLDSSTLDRWEFVQTVARLAEDVDGERPGLLAAIGHSTARASAGPVSSTRT